MRTIADQVDGFRAMQVKATSIGAAAKDIKAGLKSAAEAIIESLAAIEKALKD